MWCKYKDMLVDLPALKEEVVALGNKLNEFALSNSHRGQLLGCFARALSGNTVESVDSHPSPLMSSVPTPLMVEGGQPFHSK